MGAKSSFFTTLGEKSNKTEKALTSQRDPLRRQRLFMWRTIQPKPPIVKREIQKFFISERDGINFH